MPFQNSPGLRKYGHLLKLKEWDSDKTSYFCDDSSSTQSLNKRKIPLNLPSAKLTKALTQRRTVMDQIGESTDTYHNRSPLVRRSNQLTHKNSRKSSWNNHKTSSSASSKLNSPKMRKSNKNNSKELKKRVSSPNSRADCIKRPSRDSYRDSKNKQSRFNENEKTKGYIRQNESTSNFWSKIGSTKNNSKSYAYTSDIDTSTKEKNRYNDNSILHSSKKTERDKSNSIGETNSNEIERLSNKSIKDESLKKTKTYDIKEVDNKNHSLGLDLEIKKISTSQNKLINLDDSNKLSEEQKTKPPLANSVYDNKVSERSTIKKKIAEKYNEEKPYNEVSIRKQTPSMSNISMDNSNKKCSIFENQKTNQKNKTELNKETKKSNVKNSSSNIGSKQKDITESQKKSLTRSNCEADTSISSKIDIEKSHKILSSKSSDVSKISSTKTNSRTKSSRFSEKKLSNSRNSRTYTNKTFKISRTDRSYNERNSRSPIRKISDRITSRVKKSSLTKRSTKYNIKISSRGRKRKSSRKKSDREYKRSKDRRDDSREANKKFSLYSGPSKIETINNKQVLLAGICTERDRSCSVTVNLPVSMMHEKEEHTKNEIEGIAMRYGLHASLDKRTETMTLVGPKICTDLAKLHVEEGIPGIPESIWVAAEGELICDLIKSRRNSITLPIDVEASVQIMESSSVLAITFTGGSLSAQINARSEVLKLLRTLRSGRNSICKHISSPEILAKFTLSNNTIPMVCIPVNTELAKFIGYFRTLPASFGNCSNRVCCVNNTIIDEFPVSASRTAQQLALHCAVELSGDRTAPIISGPLENVAEARRLSLIIGKGHSTGLVPQAIHRDQDTIMAMVHKSPILKIMLLASYIKQHSTDKFGERSTS